MDNQKRLEDWVLNLTQSLDFKIERMSWIKDWFPEYFDIRTTVHIEGKDFVGRGIAKDEGTAFNKSLSELVERFICFHHKIESNGVAAHYDLEKAQKNAEKELIERDAILCHHLTERPFILTDYPTRFSELKERLLNLGMDFKLGEALSPHSDYEVVFCQISGREKFGAFWGFGCDFEKEEAFDHAVFEAMINASAYIYGLDERESISLNEFKELSRVRGYHHQNVHFSEDLRKLKMESMSDLYFSKITNDDIKLNELEKLGTPFGSSPLYVVQAKSSRLQNIFYGLPDKEKINFERLIHFYGENLELSDLSKVPHPIG